MICESYLYTENYTILFEFHVLNSHMGSRAHNLKTKKVAGE